MNIWSLLNNNSAAVQAVSSVVSTMVTGILAILTARYVNLTRDLLDAARHQAEAAKSQQAIAQLKTALKLRVLVARFLRCADSLPFQEKDLDKFPRSDIWTDQDIKEFEDAFLASGSEAAIKADDLVEPLRWILREHGKASADAKGLERMSVKDYQDQLTLLKHRLKNIETPLSTQASRLLFSP